MQNYLQSPHVNCSAGKIDFRKNIDCLHFLQSTGGNVPAPAGNLSEASIVRTSAEMFKSRTFLLIQCQTT